MCDEELRRAPERIKDGLSDGDGPESGQDGNGPGEILQRCSSNAGSPPSLRRDIGTDAARTRSLRARRVRPGATGPIFKIAKPALVRRRSIRSVISRHVLSQPSSLALHH
jgi:hypothetical protein